MLFWRNRDFQLPSSASTTTSMTNVLQNIVAKKQEEIAAAKQRLAAAELQAMLRDAPAPLDFFQALAGPEEVSLIAEVKKASPSAGVIREDFDPVQIARIYAAHGAACISVLTDEPFFQGKLEYLAQIRQQVAIPLLRKDFILDSYQLLEARASGGDAVLLIAECLDDCNLRKLFNEAVELGLTPLVELYEPQNLPRVLAAGATLIGINNRDLRTFQTDLDHTIRLRQQIPDECVVVGESGIRTLADVQRLQAAGVDAILVGESLMRQRDIGAAVDALLGR